MVPSILTNLRKPKFFLTFLGSALIIFDINYYLMISLPGSQDEMCIMGINLTTENILFSIALSLLSGLLIAGLLKVLSKNISTIQQKTTMTSFSGIGLLLGTLTMFCPICALPLVSFTGFSVYLGLINNYNFIFKISSLAFLLFATYYINRQLTLDCETCVIKPKKRQK